MVVYRLPATWMTLLTFRCGGELTIEVTPKAKPKAKPKAMAAAPEALADDADSDFLHDWLAEVMEGDNDDAEADPEDEGQAPYAEGVVFDEDGHDFAGDEGEHDLHADGPVGVFEEPRLPAEIAIRNKPDFGPDFIGELGTIVGDGIGEAAAIRARVGGCRWQDTLR